MTISDLKSRLLQGTPRVTPSRVEEMLKKGADPVELRQAIASLDQRDVDDGARAAIGRLLDRGASPSAGAPSGGRSALLVRTEQLRAHAWWVAASLPEMPVTFARGPAQDAVVGGERFTPADVAAMLHALS